MKTNLVVEKLRSNSSRRGLLKKLAAASLVGAATPLLQAQSPVAADVIQFALNLEYLESEFFSIATTGQNLQQRGVPITGIGTPGPTTTSFGQVSFGNNLVFTSAAARDTADDEIEHILLLRAALTANGITPIAKPAINLDALASKGASLANEQTFLVLARIFEDIGISAYNGGVEALSGSPYLMTAARILASEGQHIGNWRLEIARLGIATFALDAADVIPPPSGSAFYSTSPSNGLSAFRTPGQVLYLAYGSQANVSAGGFFPSGVNGALNMSGAAAPAANLGGSPTSVVIGLGDSITFGETDLRYIPSYGDRGYVGKFADLLALKNAAVPRPMVINLAIDGETATSFSSGTGRTPPVTGRTDIPLAQQNLNYAADPTTPQATKLQTTIAEQKALGNSIDYIAITLGFNELAALASLPPAQALGMVSATLATYQSNYTKVLTLIRSLAPTANLYLLNYFNPFTVDPSNPANPIFAAGGSQLNAIIQVLAAQFNAGYVDVYTQFVGQIPTLTYITQFPAGSTTPPPYSPSDHGLAPIGDVHPNDAGYTVIANQVAAVPVRTS